ncbi:serine hydrolase [Pleionea sp. CnH1-48]|uniref:serine hydrolase domain-containing protein n=1 Tax=Pleionea sp. CnH1-48 TaxID=2954494 RepID=UPI00209719F0|nr:serine hydrolase [Pleionea sp. CnH1-48]MCO7227140.1 beta-lactamase family protein [Pleionea sp. CnH1-48]
MKYQERCHILLCSFLSLMLISCGSNESTPPYSYKEPAQINDGWQTAHLNELNLDDALLSQMMNNINQKVQNFKHIDSVLIAKNGRLIFHEEVRTQLDFTDNWASNQDVSLHVMNSVTKSFVSALVGIAIEQGHIANVDVMVHDYFQHKFPVANWDNEKAAITLKNWLTMRHGYVWDEWDVSYFEPTNLNAQMNASADPIQFLLDRPMTTTPGTTFAYSTGVSFGLGRLVQLATGQPLTRFMENNLLRPLDINKYTAWYLDGQIHTGSALYLTTRDMAKLGQLYLNKGVWNGQRILSESWVDESIVKHVDNGNRGYGYQWWMSEYRVDGRIYESYSAQGLGGQYIFVYPELDAIVAFTGSAYTDEELSQRNLRLVLEQYILPAIE